MNQQLKEDLLGYALVVVAVFLVLFAQKALHL